MHTVSCISICTTFVIPYNLGYGLGAAAAALASTLLATILSCYKELREQAAELMSVLRLRNRGSECCSSVRRLSGNG